MIFGLNRSGLGKLSVSTPCCTLALMASTSRSPSADHRGRPGTSRVRSTSSSLTAMSAGGMKSADGRRLALNGANGEPKNSAYHLPSVTVTVRCPLFRAMRFTYKKPSGVRTRPRQRSVNPPKGKLRSGLGVSPGRLSCPTARTTLGRDLAPRLRCPTGPPGSSGLATTCVRLNRARGSAVRASARDRGPTARPSTPTPCTSRSPTGYCTCDCLNRTTHGLAASQ